VEQGFVLNFAEARVVQEVTEHEASGLCCCCELGLFLVIYFVNHNVGLIRVVINFLLQCYGVLTSLLIELSFHKHVEEVGN
jgi:hypothetical protein